MKNAAKLAIILALVAPSVLGAQSRTALAVAAGPSFPVGKLRDTHNQGVDLNAGLIRGSDDSPIGLRLDFGYDRFPGKTVNGVKNEDRRIVAGTADLVMSASGYTFKPYVLGGAGVFKMTPASASADAKVRFGFDFGVGITMPFASKAFFLEGRLNSMSQSKAKPVRYAPVVLGILF